MSQDYANRRKVRGLTKLGRMVSEDPDLDNLLSNLSPEELEEVEKEVMKVPGPDLSDVTLVNQTGSKSDPASGDSKKSLQRNVSVEVEPKESRKQEYLRKMGWSQERKEAGLQRQDNVSCSQETKMDARNSRISGAATEGTKEEQVGAGPSYTGRREGRREVEVKGDRVSDGRLSEGRVGDGKHTAAVDGKHTDKRDTKDSSSKTKEMISKLQEKKEDGRGTLGRKEDVRKSVDSKMKGMISRLEEKEKREKEESMERERRKEELRKRDDGKMKGLVSRLEEKQSQGDEGKAEDRRRSEQRDKSNTQMDRTKEDREEKMEEKKDREGKGGVDKGMENEVKANESMRANGEGVKQNACVNDKWGNEKMEEGEEDAPTSQPGVKKKERGNCVAEKTNTPKPKTKEEEEEEESASMFDEDLQKVRNNDPNMAELNVNNSEVIKAKTLIEFSEALRDNTHIKTFALANCRADDHVAYAIAGTLRVNKTLTSINLDSNLLTSKGIMSLVQALQHNATLTELRFHNQRHICGGKSEMEMTKILKDNTTLLKLGYHFELAGPRMTMTNILSRNMDRQRQRRLQEQKQAQANGGQKGALEVPKAAGGFRSPRASPKPSPKPSPQPSPMPSPKMASRKSVGAPGPGGPPPPPPPPPPAPMLDGDFLKSSLTPVSQRKMEDRTGGRGAAKNSRDQLLASIRGSDIKQLKKVPVPKLLQ
ncbi:hypothetical protein ACEWY4_013435 [Coilia grayii]|uniref:Leiomodin-1 n=1 Tax=Coilia grayii TaxID=363190 RepID=A0ABD1JWC9_9TELE